jgi:hypothetical protein
MPDLSSAYAKLDRASLHIRDLRERATPPPDSYSIVREAHGDGPEYIYRIERLPVLDPDLPTIFGDYLTNMRAALDHLAFQLVQLDKGVATERTRFPICPTWRFHENGQRKLLRLEGVRSRSILDLVETVQPRTVNPNWPEMDQLGLLNELVNTDKHRLLIPTIHGINWNEAWWVGAPENVISLAPLKEGDEVARFDFSREEPHPDFDPHLTVHVGIDDGGVQFERGLLDVCEGIYGYVRYIVFAKFRPLFGLPAHETGEHSFETPW